MPQNRKPPEAPEEPAPIVQRDAKGRLLPGSANLNPGGRPKGLMAAVREASGGPEEMARRLLGAIEGTWGDFGPRERWDAFKTALAYGYGKPVESLIIGGPEEAPDLSLPIQDLIALARQPLATRKAIQASQSEAIPLDSEDDAEFE